MCSSIIFRYKCVFGEYILNRKTKFILKKSKISLVIVKFKITFFFQEHTQNIPCLHYRWQVNNTLDIWNYLSHQFIHKIFPKRLSGADVRLVYDRGFMDDDCSYKIGLIQLRQMRVNGKLNSIRTKGQGTIMAVMLPFS